MAYGAPWLFIFLLFYGIESAAFTPSQSNQPASQPKELNLRFLAPFLLTLTTRRRDEIANNLIPQHGIDNQSKGRKHSKPRTNSSPRLIPD